MSAPCDRARRRLERGELSSALSALPASSRDPQVQHMRGVVLLRLGRGQEAVTAMARAAALEPGQPAWAEAHAETLMRIGRWDEADAVVRPLLVQVPQRATVLDLAGRCAMERGELAEALRCLTEALRLRPAHAATLANLAVALNRAGAWSEAAVAARSALRVQPDLVAARINLGQSLRALGQYDEALAALAPASHDPRARFNCGFIHLRRGDLARAWPLHEARLEVPGAARGPGVPWEGDRVQGTLAVAAEQGLGDLLLMAGLLPRAMERAEHVVLQCPEPLERLVLRSIPGIECVRSLADVRAEAWVPLMSLPHRLGVTRAQDFPAAPWIRPMHQGSGPGRPRIGVNWAGNPRYAYDAIRSTSLGTLAPLLEDSEVEWCSLHRGAREHEAAAIGLAQPLANARDFLDTAEVLAGLDMVISTETAVPNLSCAMGIPTVVLTTPDPDWRWLHAYRGVVVAAQHRIGEWEDAIDVARAAVRALTAARAAA